MLQNCPICMQRLHIFTLNGAGSRVRTSVFNIIYLPVFVLFMIRQVYILSTMGKVELFNIVSK